MDNQAYRLDSPKADHASENNGSVQIATSVPQVTPMPLEDHEVTTHSSEGKKPLLLCRLIVQHHKLAFGLALGLHLFMLLLTGVLVAGGVNVVDLNFEIVPLDLLENPTFLRALAWQNKDEDGSVLGKDTDAAVLGERSRTADTVSLIYRGDGTVFTADRLREMQKFEDKFLTVPEYQNFCKLPPGSVGGSASCLKPLSILRFFDGSYGHWLNDTTFSDVSGTLYRASLVPQLNQILQFHLAVDGEISRTEAKSSVTRTLIYLGYPLAGHDLSADNKTEQSEKIREFQVDHFLDILEDALDDGVGDMEFLFYGFELVTASVVKQVIFDLLLAVGSLLFIFLFMLFMTRSLFITGFGIFGIVSSFLITNLVYRFIFQFQYFGIFHVLSIFIILGIGADNIFVFVDTWRGSANVNFPDLEHRLSACYGRAASATLVTSLTTMVAFFSNALSPLLAIQSFGLYSGILVFVNYMSVILFFPAVIIVYHNHWENWTWPCFRSKCCNKDGENYDLRTDKERHHPIVRFFRGPFYTLLTHKVLRFVLLVVCLGLIVLFSVFAAKIEPDEKSLRYYQDSHTTSQAMDLLKEGFKPSAEDPTVKVYIVFGFKNQDLGTCQKSDFTCKGETVWDNGFDLNPKRAQSALLKFCERIQNLTQTKVDQLKIRRNSVTNLLEVECFVERINAYMQVESSKAQYPAGTDLTLPTAEAKVETLITSNPTIYNVTSVSPLLYRYCETLMGYWLHDGYTRTADYYDYRVYSDYLGEGRDSFDTQAVVSNPDYNWATKLLYAAVVVNTTVIQGTQPYDEGLDIIYAWEQFTEEQASLMPSSLSGMFPCTPEGFNAWHILFVQKELVDTAVLGIAVGISLAFVVITLATKNIITGFLATVNIGLVTLTVVGLIPMAGWKLGVLESLNLSLVVGLAVDYVVHLAEGYHASPAEDRLTRTRDMLEHVGISILSGALTTLGAAVFMFAAVILFFMQFGVFIFATIGFSLFYALFGFSVLMALLGPQGTTGSLVPVFWWIRYRLRGKRSHHVICDSCKGKGFHRTESLPRDMMNLSHQV